MKVLLRMWILWRGNGMTVVRSCLGSIGRSMIRMFRGLPLGSDYFAHDASNGN